MKRIIVYLGCWLVVLMAQAQQTDWMEKLSDEHPRYLTNASDKADELCQSGNMNAKATYALWSEIDGKDLLLFMGNGIKLEIPSLSIVCDKPTDVLLEKKDGDWWYTASNTCTLEVNKAKFILTPTVKPLKLKDF